LRAAIESTKEVFSPDKDSKAAFPPELAASIIISCENEKLKFIITTATRIKYFILNYF